MLEVYVDGASSGNPGPSGVGIVIKNKQHYLSYHFYVGILSNHEAEIHAVIKALQLCIDNFPDQILSLRSDSQLVVDMIEKGHTKNKIYQPLLKEILAQIEMFPNCFIKWVPNKHNKNADRLAREAIIEWKNTTT